MKRGCDNLPHPPGTTGDEPTRRRRNEQVRREHALANGFIVLVNQAPVSRFAAGSPLTDTGKNGAKKLFAENHQCSDNADGFGWDGISASGAQLGKEVLGPALSMPF